VLGPESAAAPPSPSTSDTQRGQRLLRFQLETEAAEAELWTEGMMIRRLQLETERLRIETEMAELEARKAAAETATANSRQRLHDTGVMMEMESTPSRGSGPPSPAKSPQHSPRSIRARSTSPLTEVTTLLQLFQAQQQQAADQRREDQRRDQRREDQYREDQLRADERREEQRSEDRREAMEREMRGFCAWNSA